MSLREVIYFSLASGLGLFTFIFFLFSRNPRLKQRLWTSVHILGGALFIAFMLGRDMTMIGTFFTVFGTLGVVYLSLSNSRFCGECAALIFGPERPEWRGKCPSCGARLPWSEFYPGPESPPSAGGNGAVPSDRAGKPESASLPEPARTTAEIDRTFETEGEHHASAEPAGRESSPEAES